MAYAIIIFAVLFADQLSKALIFAFNVEGLTIIPGLLALDKTMNTGMAFGMLGDKEWAIPVFIAVTSVAMVVFLVLLVKTKPSRRFMRTALALILCGALGNFIDRVVLEGVARFHRAERREYFFSQLQLQRCGYRHHRGRGHAHSRSAVYRRGRDLPFREKG